MSQSYRIYGIDGWADIDLTPEGSAIYVRDRYGEIVCWNSDEWTEDPETVVNAILGSLGVLGTHGAGALRETIQNYPRPGEQKAALRDVIENSQSLEAELHKLLVARREISLLTKSESPLSENSRYDKLFKAMGRVVEMMFKDRWGPL